MNLLVLINLKMIIGYHYLSLFLILERREQLVIGGTFRDKIQVASISTLSGIFKKTWLGIKPNNKMVNLRCCEIHELKMIK